MPKYLSLSLIIAIATACSAKPHSIITKLSSTSPRHNEIFVVNHGWHTGIVIPAKDIQAHLPELNKRFQQTSYIEFGWGDKGFYQAKEITTWLTLRAILWPTESVVHTVSVPNNVYAFFPNSQIESLCLSTDAFSTLIQFIRNSFLTNEDSHVIKLRAGIYGDSQFYKGEGDYYSMNTCNKWTAKGLKSAGLDISPTFKLTAGSIMNYLQQLSDVEKSCHPR